jgi:5'-nucleotidase
MKKPQILLTNDDGIQSPGLWMAASRLSELGFVHVVAPRDQYSGGGRSMPNTSDGIIRALSVHVNDKDWTVYSVGGSPAQAVQHAVLEIMPRQPDLVVSGINYGENMGTAVTISGTVGAALEGAALGIPSLAISLETGRKYHLSYSVEVDFSAAGHFAHYFASLILACQLPEDVDVLKVDIPALATPETPWEITRLTRKRYYVPLPPTRTSWEQPAVIDYKISEDPCNYEPGSDVYALCAKQVVSVTPLSLDLTSRVDFKQMETCLRQQAGSFSGTVA